MKPNRVREVIAAGGMPVGHMIMEFARRGIAKICESAGVDFVVIDMEHSGFGIDTAADLIAWFKATPIAPFVRVPEAEYHWIARILDAGALGIMVPNVQSAEHAGRAISAMKYAPKGARGLGLGTAHNDYVAPPAKEYLEEANRNTLLICQIESEAGLANLESIAALESVDVLWVGHSDLSHSLGITGEFEHPRMIDALRQVAEAASRHGKIAGIQPGNEKQLRDWVELGYRMISYGSDITVYGQALRKGIAAVRAL